MTCWRERSASRQHGPRSAERCRACSARGSPYDLRCNRPRPEPGHGVADAIEEDSNATDELIRLALDAAASLDPAAELTVSVDGEEMGRGEVVPFAVRPGTVVIALPTARR